MENRKWLKRKYPKSFDKINKFLNDEQLEIFKKNKYRLGKIITNPNWNFYLYPPGTLIMFKRSNPINDYNYPMCHAIAKCKTKITPTGHHPIVTPSGYHSIHVFPSYFKEIHQ